MGIYTDALRVGQLAVNQGKDNLKLIAGVFDELTQELQAAIGKDSRLIYVGGDGPTNCCTAAIDALSSKRREMTLVLVVPTKPYVDICSVEWAPLGFPVTLSYDGLEESFIPSFDPVESISGLQESLIRMVSTGEVASKLLDASSPSLEQHYE